MGRGLLSVVMLGWFFLSVAAVPVARASAAIADTVSVPFILDHHRIMLPVHLTAGNGEHLTVQAWLDNGNPVLSISGRLAEKIGLRVDPRGRVVAAMRGGIMVGGLLLPIAGLPVEIEKSATIGSGLSAAINLPSTLLRQYDVVVDYPAGRLVIGKPGTIRFEGTRINAYIHPQNGLIQIASTLGTDTFHLALDLGTPVSFVATGLLSKWRKAYPSWPSVTGAIGVANLWGMADEPNWNLLRVHHLLCGGVALGDLAAVGCPPDWLAYFIRRVGMRTAGLIGAEALSRFRIGIDYAHGIVYLRQSSTGETPDFDVVGLVLRPESHGRFTVLGVAKSKGIPALAGVRKGDTLLAVNGHAVSDLSMGRVWDLLSGTPGAVYTLELGRQGNRVRIKAVVRRYLARTGL